MADLQHGLLELQAAQFCGGALEALVGVALQALQAAPVLLHLRLFLLQLVQLRPAPHPLTRLSGLCIIPHMCILLLSF